MAVVTRSRGAKKTATPAMGRTAKKRRLSGKVKKTMTKIEKNNNELSKNGLRSIHMIDYDGNFNESMDLFHDKWAPRLSHVPHRVSRLIGNGRKNSKAYLYFQHEIDGSDITNNTPVPVLVAIICNNTPTLSIAKYDTQTQAQEIESFEQKGLTWERLTNSDVYVLKKSNGQPGVHPNDTMNLRKPDEVSRELPRDVGLVKVQYNNKTYEWQLDSESLPDFLDGEMEDGNIGSEEDKEEIKKLLTEKKKSLKRAELEKVQQTQAKYNDMVNEIARSSEMGVDEVETNLGNMKVFKIFPSGLPQPIATIFGDSGGFRFKLQVNGRCKADDFYVE